MFGWTTEELDWIKCLCECYMKFGWWTIEEFELIKCLCKCLYECLDDEQ
jgi:hypothetical protein